MKTEAEANKLWCPMVRYGGGGDESLGNDYLMANNIGAKCGASRCMMWRWDKYVMFFPETNSLQTASAIDGKAVGAPKGFCGLGGQP